MALKYFKLQIGKEKIDIADKRITEIANGKAKTNTNRWYDIVCDCLELKDYEMIEADVETNIPESYIVCNHCNRVTYTKDFE